MKRLAGYPGRRKPRPGAPGLSPSDPVHTPEDQRAEMPVQVRRDAAAAAEWVRLAPKLELLGLLDTTNQQLFAAYCMSWSVYVKARAQVMREGFTYRAANGMRKKHPAFEAMKAAGSEMRRFAVEFGISPASRTKVTPSTQLPLPGVQGKPAAPTSPPEGDDAFFGARPPIQ